MPFWPLWFDSTRAVEVWDGTIEETPVCIKEESVVVLDDSSYVEWVPLEDTCSLELATDPLVCPDENVTLSWSYALESPPSSKELSTAKVHKYKGSSKLKI